MIIRNRTTNETLFPSIVCVVMYQNYRLTTLFFSIILLIFDLRVS